MNAARSAYVERLIELGFASQSGRVHQKLLADHILAYHHSFNYLTGGVSLARCVTGTLPWIARLVRTPRGAQHPLRHLLLAMAIFPTWADFDAALKKDPHRKPKERPSSSRADLKERIQSLVGKRGLSLRQTAHQLGVDVSTVRVYAESLGLRISLRPKHITPTKALAVRRSLEKGFSITRIAQTRRLSSVSVYRILRGNLASKMKRERVLFLRERSRRREHIQKTIRRLALHDRRAIRHRCTMDVVWLQRHDCAWLRNFITRFPSTSARLAARVDWRHRDRELLVGLRLAYRQMLCVPGKPLRLTVTEIGRRVGRLDWLEKHLEKLPLCNRFLSGIVETRLDYRIRRVRWAIGELGLRGEPVTAWHVRRLAGIGRDEEDEVTKLIQSASDARATKRGLG